MQQRNEWGNFMGMILDKFKIFEIQIFKKHTNRQESKDLTINRMSIYSSFFTPQTISILLCLQQTVKQGEEPNPTNPIIQFLIQKILKLTQHSRVQTTNEGFEGEMFSVINDIDFMEQYRESLGRIDSFNSFYRELSSNIKTLKSIRNGKLQQGNVIDFLVRRLYIYFQKLDFKEIVQIYDNFNAYRYSQPYQLRQHQFMLTKSIQQVKFNLENYAIKQNSQQINKLLKQLSQTDHTFKTSYIKGLYKAVENKPNESMHELHRYFDKCLGNLFQQKSQSSPASNKINHCIISMAYSSLKMGHLQECLQAISQGLRISQNNSDQESINNCIIYLYKIAEQLGKYQQEILLAQHAITHSLNLSNIVLMVYSCLCYSGFDKKYNCQNTEVALLKSRHISWTQALHFSKKKIYSNFQSNCKNIYHSFRNLLIPTFLHKLSILIHVPQLKPLFINPYYKRKQLFDLQVYQQFQGYNIPVDQSINKAKRYFNMNQPLHLNKAITKLLTLQKQAQSPQTIIKIKKFFCHLHLDYQVQINCHKSIQQFLDLCKNYGFVKAHLIQAMNFNSKLLIKNQLFFDALVKIEETIKFCEQNSFPGQNVVSQLLKAQALIETGNIFESLEIIRMLDEDGIIQKVTNQDLTLFWQTKLLALRKVIQTLETQITYLNELSELKKFQFLCFQNLLKCYLNQGSITKVKRNIQEQQDFIILNPLIVDKKQTRQQRLKNILTYIDKVQTVYKNIDNDCGNEEEFDEETVQQKVMKKIEMIFFNN